MYWPSQKTSFVGYLTKANGPLPIVTDRVMSYFNYPFSELHSTILCLRISLICVMIGLF